MMVESLNKDVKIEGTMLCVTPLSHIGETHSVGSFFNTEEILVDNEWKSVPTYTGNALRGMLRRYSRDYLCRNIGNITLSEDWFSKLSFGGGTSDTMLIDVKKRRLERQVFPMLSIFGYGLGSMSGKLSSMPMRLICEETKYIVPYKYQADTLFSANEHIGNQAFTRMDDFKDDKAVSELLTSKDDIETNEKGQRKLKDGESTTQMRYEVEMIKTGSKWYFRFDLSDVTDIEIGCFISALVEWGKYSRLGGMHNKGYGLVLSHFDFTDLTSNEKIDNFMQLTENSEELSDKAKEYKQYYDMFLKETIIPILDKYNNFLSDSKSDIVKMLGEVK